MKTLTRMTAVSTLILGVCLASGMAWADSPRTRLVPSPGIVPSPNVPSLGYAYVLVPGYGFRVTGVMAGSLAERLGLEVGDIVVSINNHRLNHVGADVPARAEAARYGGWVRLRIRDVRTGRIIYRSVNLFGRVRPVYPDPIGMPNPIDSSSFIMPAPGSALR